ncbi:MULTISPECIES: hypothetical protein [Delftia]|uniref:Uncharacterized protein n=1 Tax=Delftia acidovorans TaxID=80866 RepID=A0A7T2S3H8_DELAC|nr:MULTISPECIES: hypothetical protein [Delftia]QPS08177.1 hypothetical protein I6G66_28620 [Delftia acidovorans]
MKKYIYLIFGLLVIVAILAVYRIKNEGGGDGREIVAEKSVNASLNAEGLDAIKNEADQVGGHGLGRAKPGEGGGIYDTKNLKEYYERVKKNPQNGGYFYAQAAITSCRQKVSLLTMPQSGFSSENIVREKQILAQNKLRELCQGFSDADIKESYIDLQRNGRNLGDPLIIAQQDMIDSSTKEEFESSLKNIFAKKDVYLASSVWPNFGKIRGFDGSGKNEFFFEGESYSTDRELTIYQAAWQIVPCVSGVRCEMGSDTVLMATCVDEGVCMETREGLVEHQFGSDKASYRKAVDLARKLSNAVEQGRYQLFLPPQ